MPRTSCPYVSQGVWIDYRKTTNTDGRWLARDLQSKDGEHWDATANEPAKNPISAKERLNIFGSLRNIVQNSTGSYTIPTRKLLEFALALHVNYSGKLLLFQRNWTRDSELRLRETNWAERRTSMSWMERPQLVVDTVQLVYYMELECRGAQMICMDRNFQTAMPATAIRTGVNRTL